MSDSKQKFINETIDSLNSIDTDFKKYSIPYFDFPRFPSIENPVVILEFEKINTKWVYLNSN